MKLFHNPACSKSRQALALLEERGARFELVEYLKAPPDRATLTSLLGRLDAEPSALVRRDKRFRELGLADADCTTDAQVVTVLLEHPELMERPVLDRGDRAVIGRPPEKVLDLLD